MKHLPMTPALAELITKAVGVDVDTSKLTVFETIALNTKPLPGKGGTIFEKAVVEPITLTQMVDFINAGNHIPLIADHELFGAPKGRFFHAGLYYDPEAGFDSLEMRALFYLDETERALIDKIDAGSLDEVSVSFLSTQFLCSECGWDYFEFGTDSNIRSHTCENGHTIGEDGVHAKLVGLNQFIELSLVVRGAADKPKIVGKSQAKLAPETAYRLAAHGFEPDALVVNASLGEENMSDLNATMVTDLVAAKTEVGVLTAQLGVKDAAITSLTSERDTAVSRVSELETELAAAKDAKPEDYETAKSERDEAVSFLQEQTNHLLVASGKPKLEGDALSAKPTELKAKISELTGNLTSILPVDGRSNSSKTDSGDKDETPGLRASGFKVRK